MFEENNNINEFDLMVKSILDEGQEEVPACVWEAVSDGLDKAASRKAVVIWFRRAAVSVAAAAAVAVTVIFNIRPQTDIIPMDGGDGLIAVAGQVENSEAEEAGSEILYTEPLIVQERSSSATDHKKADRIPQTAAEAMTYSDAESAESQEITDSQIIEQPAHTQKPEHRDSAAETPREYFPEDWGEEEVTGKREISLMLSGLASTNSTQNKNRIAPMKAPTVTSAPKNTGVTETSTNSTYGLPFSIGAGVKIGLSPRWSIGTGANYTILSRQFYGKYILVDKNGRIEESTSSDIRNTQHFIGIPVNAYYDIIDKERLNLYAYAGGTFEKCASDNYRVLNTSIHHKEKVKGLQLSANIGLGVEFMLGRHLGIYIDPSLRYYFDCNQPKSIRTVQPLMLGFEMGFRARL